MDITEQDLLNLHREATLWNRLMGELRKIAMGTDEQLLELARISVRDALANEQLWRDDRNRSDAYRALEAIVTADIAHSVTISGIAGTFDGVTVEVEGDTISREDLTAALLSMARARGVGGTP